MLAGGGVDAAVSENEALDGAAFDEVGLDDLGNIRRSDAAVPDGFRIDDDAGPVLALVEAAGLVDADRIF